MNGSAVVPAVDEPASGSSACPRSSCTTPSPGAVSSFEDTLDWYAQDREGNVWYFGEDTKASWHGVRVSTKGSWVAGKDGAEPGVVMKARPRVGDRYRQEHSPGIAEDMAQVLGTTERVSVPFGSFAQVVMTKDVTPLEPDTVEHKYYARGVGNVLEVEGKTGTQRLELVEVVRA